MNQSSNIIETIQKLVADLALLFRQELALARVETEEKIATARNGLVALTIGVLFIFAALLVLVQSLVMALSQYMTPVLACLLVGAVLASIGFLAIKIGSTRLRPGNLAPKRTVHSVSESLRSFKESV